MIKNRFTKLYLCCIIRSEAAWPFLNLTAAFSGPVYAVHTKNKNQGGYLKWKNMFALSVVLFMMKRKAMLTAELRLAPNGKMSRTILSALCAALGKICSKKNNRTAHGKEPGGILRVLFKSVLENTK